MKLDRDPPKRPELPPIRGKTFLKFRCTGCANCCRDPRLPLTHADVRRVAKHTGDAPSDFVNWVTHRGIDMDDEPEWFVQLSVGKRVMVLKHEREQCRYLGGDGACTIYTARPTGCRTWPLRPTFAKDGRLRQLEVIKTVECPYELDGHNDPEDLRKVNERYDREEAAYVRKVERWNARQTRRRAAGERLLTAAAFYEFLGVT